MARREAVNNDSDPIIVSSEDIESVKVKIAGEIATSKSPGITMKKWRQLFGEKQRDVAARMGVAPSVLSEYEEGKGCVGMKFVKRYVEGGVAMELEKG
ncbi:MAG: helix-turn-helix domain-containing protein, partial [Nitrososphaerota archaeon]